MKKFFFALASFVLLIVAACTDADVVSRNISEDADMFKINRRIVFFNGITDTYLMTIEGKCSLGNQDSKGQLSVTCKTGEEEYKKHFLGLSDNVSYLVEQIDGANVSKYHYKVIFKPSIIIPDIDLE